MLKKLLLATTLLATTIEAEDIHPIGTVMHSILPESVFQSKMGTEWVLLDGRVITDRSSEIVKYILVNDKGEPRLPDAQGKFIRMMDYRAINDGNRTTNGDPEHRTMGSYQRDEFKSHNHNNDSWSGLVRYDGTNTVKYPTDNSRGEINIRSAGGIVAQGGSETRPKNIAINIFIKIKSCQSTQCK